MTLAVEIQRLNKRNINKLSSLIRCINSITQKRIKYIFTDKESNYDRSNSFDNKDPNLHEPDISDNKDSIIEGIT